MRVADLARELGLSSVDLMGLLDDLGITVVSDASMLQQSQVRVVRAQLSVRALPFPEEAVVPVAVVEEADAPVRAPEPFTVTEPSGPPGPFTVAEPTSGATPAVANLAETINTDREWDAALGRARRPILLWGPPGSGKSTFLAGMMFRQTDDDADPFDWRIMPVGMRAGDHIRSVLQAYRAGGQPNATLVTEAPFRFKVRKYRRKRSLWGVIPLPEMIRLEADLLFVDPPGELFTVSRMRSRAGERLLELMEKAAGMLLLIDPTFSEPDDLDHDPSLESDEERETLRRIRRQRRYWSMLVENLSEIVDHLRQRPRGVQAATLDEENRLRIPTAICVTKMDQHPGDAHRPAEFLREQIGEAAFGLIENSFSNYTVYACSALGNEVRTTADGIRLAGNPRPWGVVDPIRWILEEALHKPRVLARFGW